MSMNRIVGILFGAAVVWGLYQQAARPVENYYRLFIFLSIPAVLAVLTLPTQRLRGTRFLALIPLLWILVAIVLHSTISAQGFVVAGIGWLALFVTLLLTEQQLSSARSLFLFLIMVGGAEALYGLTQSLGTDEFAKGTYTNRNHFTGLLNMIIPLAIGGLFANHLSSKERLRTEILARAWTILLSVAFMGLGILLSLSRMGTISLILSLVFLASLLAFSTRKSAENRQRKKKLSSSAIWILLFMVIGLSAWVGMEELIARFGVIDEIENKRFVTYTDTLRMIVERPILGVGLGMYRWEFRPYQTQDAAWWWTHAHNDYLESAADWGVPLAMLFWGFVVWRWWQSVKVFLYSRDPWKQGIALGCAGAIFSILLHSLVDFNLQIPANWAVFCIILGLSWSVDTDTDLHGLRRIDTN